MTNELETNQSFLLALNENQKLVGTAKRAMSNTLCITLLMYIQES